MEAHEELRRFVETLTPHLQMVINRHLSELRIRDQKRWMEFYSSLTTAIHHSPEGIPAPEAQMEYLIYQAGLDLRQIATIIFAQIELHYRQHDAELQEAIDEYAPDPKTQVESLLANISEPS